MLVCGGSGWFLVGFGLVFVGFWLVFGWFQLVFCWVFVGLGLAFDGFCWFCWLLSGDVEFNPGPTNYPCAVCGKGVRSKGVFCTNCGLWVHPKCENISNTEYKKLSKIPAKDFNFTCSLCLKENSESFTWDLFPFNNETLVEMRQNVSIDATNDLNQFMDGDMGLPLKMRGLHFIHLNINSLLSKIDELRVIAKVQKAAIIGITESKLDDSVLDGEVEIEGYKIIRSDRK